LISFARRAGYQKLMLWTNNVLEEAYHGFGHDLIGEAWELDLASR
jgi:hypothetical protein